MQNVINYLSNDVVRGNFVAMSRTGFSDDVKDHYVNQKGCYLYTVRYNTDDGQPITILKTPTDNHYCEIIVTTPIDFGKMNYVLLSTRDIMLLKRYFD